jgi:hypothetical protein
MQNETWPDVNVMFDINQTQSLIDQKQTAINDHDFSSFHLFIRICSRLFS